MTTRPRILLPLTLVLGMAMLACEGVGGRHDGSGGDGSAGSGGSTGSGGGDAGSGPGGSGGGGDTGSGAGGSGPVLGSTRIGIGRRHDPAWVTHFGGDGDDEALAVHASAAGVFLGGQTASAWFDGFADPCVATSDDAGNDCGDAFVLNADSGEGIQFGGPQTDATRGVFATSSAVYAVGRSRQPESEHFRTDGFITELSADLSSRQWETKIATAKQVEEVLALAVDGAGDLFVSGGSASPIGGQSSKGREDSFVMRLDPSGSIVAAKTFGSPVFEELMGVAVDADAVYAVGQTGGYLGDDPSGKNLGSTDVFLTVMDRTLTRLVCRAQFGTTGKDVGQAVSVTEDAIYISGFTEGTMNGDLANGATCNQALPTDELLLDVFVAKFDKACHHVWTRQFGGRAGDTSDGIASDGQYVYVVGTTGGATDHTDTPDGTDAYLRVYDADGEVVGEILFDSDEPGVDHADLGRAVAIHDGFVHVVGRTAGDLGPRGSNLGGTDAFLARIPVAEARGNVTYRGTGCP